MLVIEWNVWIIDIPISAQSNEAERMNERAKKFSSNVSVDFQLFEQTMEWFSHTMTKIHTAQWTRDNGYKFALDFKHLFMEESPRPNWQSKYDLCKLYVMKNWYDNRLKASNSTDELVVVRHNCNSVWKNLNFSDKMWSKRMKIGVGNSSDQLHTSQRCTMYYLNQIQLNGNHCMDLNAHMI